MTKIRVHELAKELGVSSKEIITLLMNEFNKEVKNHMSVVDDKDAELIKELFIENAKKQTTVENKEIAVETKKGIVEEYEEILEEEVLNVKIKKNKKQEAEEKVNKDQKIAAEKAKDFTILEIDKTITVKEIAERFNKPTNEVMKQLMFVGVMASMNQEIDFNTAQKLAEKFEFKLVLRETENLGVAEEEEDLFEDKEEGQKRPPVVTVMGHVDHGKTSLLDAIRKAKVTESEAGGITQHIGAYTVDINGEKVTFLDTPGHEAFTAMRARGAQITDIVILVVAADDGLMPQTIEAINHCKAANVPIIVAINKIDKAGANVENVKQELTQYGLVSEDWGGDTVCLPVSARTKEGLDELLEMVVLTAEIQELKANPNRHAKGTVIEAKLDKQRGPIASLLVQNGTLHVGDSILVGSTYGRIRAMFDDKGKKIKTAAPSIPVEILGLSEVPAAGDRFGVVKDEKTARDLAQKRHMKLRSEYLQSTHKVSLEDLYNQIKEGKIKELGLIVKADVQGSLEAIRQTLEKLSNDSVKVRVIHGAVGTITETDINLASSSNAIIIGFNVRPDTNALLLADKEAVEIKTYSIIYNAIDDIKAAMEGMLEPEYKEVILGRTEIRQIYKVSNVGTIAGCYVLDGKITRGASIRLLRSGIIILDGTLNSLKRFKDDAKEVAAGYECGLSIEKFNDIREGDIIEAYEMQEIKPKAKA